MACLQVSAAVAAFSSGHLADLMGRKRCVRFGGFIYLVTAFIQAFAPNLAAFIAGRTLQGLASGILSMTVPIIQTEIARPHRVSTRMLLCYVESNSCQRGLMVGVEYTCLIASYALSCWVNYGIYFLLPSIESWRTAFYVQFLLASVLLFMSFFLPDTPRWLASHGFEDHCLQTVADLHSAGDTSNGDVQNVFLEIQEAVRYERTLGQPSWTVRRPQL